MTMTRKLAVAMPWLLVASLLLSVCVSAAPPPEKRRGRLIRTDVQRTETTSSFRWRLSPSPDSRPRLFFEEVTLLTLHKVNIHQVVVEIPAATEANPAGVEYRPVPGETMEGETFTVQNSQIAGPLAEEIFLINDVPMTTDEAGVAIDENQTLLRLFDDLTTTEVTVRAHHARLGSVLLPLTRNIMKRYAAGEKPPANLAQTDVLASLGLDFIPKRTGGRQGVTMSAKVPENIRAGEPFEIALTVVNQGDMATSSLLGRTFSRFPWLHGRLFYVGGVEPGQSRTFTRRFVVSADAKGGTVFGGLGFWDIMGTMNNQGIVLKMALEGAPEKPAAENAPAEPGKPAEPATEVKPPEPAKAVEPAPAPVEPAKPAVPTAQ